MQATIDLETTSADLDTARIVEIAILVDGDKALHALVNPECPIEPGATEVHGITNDRVAECKTIDDLAGDIVNVLRGADEINGYNVDSFDLPILRRLVPAMSDVLAPTVDPVWTVRHRYPHVRVRKLVDICSHVGVAADRANAHSAFADCHMALGLRRALCHDDTEQAAEESARLRRFIEAERAKFGYWLYVDRDDGRTIRMLCGKHIGLRLAEVDISYIRWILSNRDIKLPPAVEVEFRGEMRERAQ